MDVCYFQLITKTYFVIAFLLLFQHVFSWPDSHIKLFYFFDDVPDLSGLEAVIKR